MEQESGEEQLSQVVSAHPQAWQETDETDMAGDWSRLRLMNVACSAHFGERGYLGL